MTIVSVAYPLFPVTTDSSGGAEQVLALLDRAIVEHGHTSIVVAARGSQVRGTLIETTDSNGIITDEILKSAQRDHAAAIDQVIQSFPVDILHFHGLDFPFYLPETMLTAIATIHLPLDWYSSPPLRTRAFPVCVSRSQAAGTGCAVIPNGVDTERFQPSQTRGDYLLWLGRVCPEKGVDIALRVAQQADMELQVAGPVHSFEWHQQYFRSEVEPLLDGKRRYLGAVQGLQKSALLASAKALLIPSKAAETSSLVAMEALSSGTPIVAFASGAVPEVVCDGRTGFIVQSEDEMVEAVKRVEEISRLECRAEALQRFDFRRMAGEYLQLYAQRLNAQGTSAV